MPARYAVTRIRHDDHIKYVVSGPDGEWVRDSLEEARALKGELEAFAALAPNRSSSQTSSMA